MKKLNFILGISISVILFSTGCDPREEAVQPVACFDYYPTTIEVGDEVTFTDCSSDAVSYYWDFDDGRTSVSPNPKHTFDEAGEYNVTLMVENKNLRNDITHKVVVEAGQIEINPKVYDQGAIWVEYYIHSYDASGEWAEETNSDYSAIISEGFYVIENFSTESNWYFWTNSAGMPAETENFDFEARLRLDYDNAYFGSGLFWYLNPDNSKYYIYRYSAGYYNMGDSENGLYLTDWIGKGYESDFNMFTVRLYNGTYYFFLNEDFIFESNHIDEFGEKFGFFIGKETKVTIDWISIYTMDLSGKKSASLKEIKSREYSQSRGVSVESINNIIPFK